MDTRPGKSTVASTCEGRGSGAAARKRRTDALGPRKDIIIRMPEDIARRLKIVAASEGTTVTDYCLQILVPHIERDFEQAQAISGIAIKITIYQRISLSDEVPSDATPDPTRALYPVRPRPRP